MQIFSPHPYRKWFVVGFVSMVVAAWFSVGYHHPDEHFQLLELANYKLGQSPLSALSWEFSAQCRPGFQPFLVYAFVKLLNVAGIDDPLLIAFALRLVMGLLTWWLTCRLVLLLLPTFTTDKGKWMFVVCSFLLWFVPYIGVRFSAENMAGFCFFLAVSFIMALAGKTAPQKQGAILVSGFLLAISVYMRPQMVAALLGLGLWLLFQRWQLSRWLLLASTFFVGIFVSVLADYWLYGTWVFSPINYFQVNVVQHKAAEFGVSPWWNYGWLFLQTAVMPISIVLLIGFFAGIWKKPKHVFSLISIFFVVAHCMIGHKELRFLFPISYAFIYLATIGLDSFVSKKWFSKTYRWVFPILAVVNIALLLYRSLAPAQEAMSYFAFIDSYARKQPTTIIAMNQSPYNLVGLDVNFYRPSGVDIQVLTDTSQLSAILNDSTGRTFLFYSPKAFSSTELAAYKPEKVYSILPDWISHFNFNHWQERSNIGVIYRLNR